MDTTVNLYAKWTQQTHKLTITYHSADDRLDYQEFDLVYDIPVSDTSGYNTEISILSLKMAARLAGEYYSSPNQFEKYDGHYFVNWLYGDRNLYLDEDEVVLAADLGANGTKDTTVDLWGQWYPYTLKVLYNANGGSGSVPTDDNSYKNGDTVTIKGKGGLSRDGYEFLGWSKGNAATTASYVENNKPSAYSLNPNVSVANCTVTLYAVWKKIETINLIVKYRADGLDKSQMAAGYGVNSDGFVTKNGEVLEQIWKVDKNGDIDSGTKYNLYDPKTFGLKPPAGCKWTTVKNAENSDGTKYRSWRMYSYTSQGSKGVSYWYTQSENEELSAKKLWARAYWSNNVKSSDGSTVSQGYRCNGSGNIVDSLASYTNNKELWVFPSIEKINLIVKYKADGLMLDPNNKNSSNYKINSDGFVTTKDGKVLEQLWSVTGNLDMDTDETYNLYDPLTFGMKLKPGYRWDYVENAENSDGTKYRSWRMYSYTSQGSKGSPFWWYTQSENEELPARKLWARAYWSNNVKSNTGVSPQTYFGKNEYYRYNGSGTQMKGLMSYTNDKELWMFPGVIKNILTVNYNANGGKGTRSSDKIGYDETVSLSSDSAGGTIHRDGYKFLGWSTTPTGSADSKFSGNVKSQTLNPDVETKDCEITLYAVWEKIPISLKVKYKISDELAIDTSKGYSIDANGFVTKDGSVVTQTWKNDGTTYDLYSPVTFGLSPKPGYRWNYVQFNGVGYNSWRLYSYASQGNKGISYWYSQNEKESISAKTLWARNYYTDGAQASDGSAVSVGWRYNGSGTLMKGLGDYITDKEVWCFPDVIKNTLTIKYDSNGGDGTKPSDKLNYDDGVDFSPDGVQRDGYEFLGWSTSPTGDVDYNPSQLGVKSQDLNPDIADKDCEVTLYAVWAKLYKVSIRYHSSDARTDYQTYESDVFSWNVYKDATGPVIKGSESATVPVCSRGVISTLAISSYGENNQFKNWDGHYFVDWLYKEKNQHINVTSITYDTIPLTVLGIDGTKDITIDLWGQWKLYTLTVNYDANGGEGTVPSQSAEYDKNVKISQQGSIQRDGYKFLGWSKTPTGGVNYNPSQLVKSQNLNPNLKDKDCEITLYAVWEKINVLRVHYDANGGSGTPPTDNNSYTADDNVNIKDKGDLTKEGYTFAGWSTTPTGDVEYSPSQVIKPEDLNPNIKDRDCEVTLYAVWKEDAKTGDLRISPIASNSLYYLNDTVFASFYIYNDGETTVFADSGVKVKGKFLYTSIDGENKSVELSPVENIVIPNNKYIDNRNVIYFKFVIPDDAMVAETSAVLATVESSADFDNNPDNNQAAIIKDIAIRIKSNTPDYGRTLSAPHQMLSECGIPRLTKYAAETTSTEIGNKASWNEWVEGPGKTLKLADYSIEADLRAIVKIDNRCLTAAFDNNDLVLKSGYAVTLAVLPNIIKGSGVTDKMYGVYNAANAYYPEYGYKAEKDKYSSLELIDSEALRTTSQFTSESASVDKANTHDVPVLGIDTRWELPQCEFSSFYIDGAGMARKHFTPLWWKDSNYTIVCDATSLWTPAGVIGAEAIAESGKGGGVYISGSVYDNYYTVRG